MRYILVCHDARKLCGVRTADFLGWPPYKNFANNGISRKRRYKFFSHSAHEIHGNGPTKWHIGHIWDNPPNIGSHTK